MTARTANRPMTLSFICCAIGLLTLSCSASPVDAKRADTTGSSGGGGGGGSGLITPEDPGLAQLRFTLDAMQSQPISPFIYGVNFYESAPDQMTPAWPANLRLSRMGGNRLTAYNWENNASNAGNDYDYHNDDYLGGGSVAGEAVRMRVAGAAAKGAGTIVTVPMIGYVSHDKDGTNVGTDPATLQTRLATRFVISAPRKGAAFAATPDTTDGHVYQDEFVSWLTHAFPGAAQPAAANPIFFSLDNEPDIWGSTHEEIRSKVNGAYQLLTYDDFLATTVSYASAIKSVAPNALVFGPALGTWAGATTLGRWPTPDPVHGSDFFLAFYLDKLRAAEQSSGRRLVDVLDLHWYPELDVGGYGVDNDYATQTDSLNSARMQAPRSLWDPTYDEHSWVSDTRGGPIRLLPYLREQVAAHYPGTKIAITEYYYGRGGDISGGVAEADALGIFGREGVFAATLWPNAGIWAYNGDADAAYAYVKGAFRMFRDYDGQRHAFGDIGISATTSDAAASSVYASTDPGSTARVVIVAINKTTSSKTAAIQLTTTQLYRTAEVYTLTNGTPAPVRIADVTLPKRNAFIYTMPATSVSTIVLRP